MLLRNLHRVEGDAPVDLRVEGDRIAGLMAAGDQVADDAICLSFADALVIPGLINSHDHLDFDLFPAFRSRTYSSYKEWGSDIHERYAEEIAAVLRIPRELRLRWGVYKNLLCGITSVVHHGDQLEMPGDLITVLQEAKSLHSVSGEKGWRRKLLFPFRQQWPLVIHTGEGTTPACSKEIDLLLSWNIFKRPLIGVHGIAMSPEQAAGFRALVWCPDSNYFLYGKTADVRLIREQTNVVFGTDSTLTSSWDMWQQLRQAREMNLVEDRALWEMVTAGPAHLWGLAGRGTIEEGCVADLVIAARPPGSLGWDAVFGLDPAQILLVLHQGKMRLFDASLRDQLSHLVYPAGDFYPVSLAGKVKYVQGDLPGLLQEIRGHHSGALFPVTAL
jgi:cytosine/adenosine deaminase-related metal-dependent hydrolase